MNRVPALLWVFAVSVSSIAYGAECQIEDVAGLYESQWGQMSCRERDGQLNCCYGNVQACDKQLHLELQPGGGELSGRWEYSNGSAGPATFPIDADCKLLSGLWGSGATANRGWTVGDRIGGVVASQAEEPDTPVETDSPASTAANVSPAGPAQCRPEDLGLYYDTNFGDLDCESTDAGMDCRFVASEIAGCEFMFLFEFDDTGQWGREWLVGRVLDSGVVGITRMRLDASCAIVQGFWRGQGPSRILKVNGLRESPGSAGPVPYTAACDIGDIGKHYWSFRGSFECADAGDSLSCDALPSQETRAAKLRSQQLETMKLRPSEDEGVLVGYLVQSGRRQPVSVPLDERCNLRDGTLGACDSKSLPGPLSMRVDPRGAGGDLSLAQPQFEIAEIYLAQRMKKEAVPHLMTAADQGHVDAKFELAQILENGAGNRHAVRAAYLEQDVDRATELYAQAAAAGHAEALTNLARRRAQEARFDALLAKAESGDADAQFQVAMLYREGKIVNYDIEAYAAWVKRAAAQEQPAALHLMAQATYDKDDPAAAQKAKAMYERAAELGHPLSWVSLAVIAFYRESSYSRAKDYLRKALGSSDEFVVQRALAAQANIKEVLANREYQKWLNSPAGVRHALDQLNSSRQSAFQNAADFAFDTVFLN